jgi:hypothetical protein
MAPSKVSYSFYDQRHELTFAFTLAWGLVELAAASLAGRIADFCGTIAHLRRLRVNYFINSKSRIDNST